MAGRARDQLLARDGRHLTITAISSRAARLSVHNFEVGGGHNDYVSTAQLLVHDCPVSGGAGGVGGGRQTNFPDLLAKEGPQ